MLRRLAIGLIEGLVIGLALGVGAARGMALRVPGSLTLLLLGAAAGFLVGLVAGRPVWARDGKTEAVLKAGVGALGGAGLAFAAAHWLRLPVDLNGFQLGAGPIGQLPALILPGIATALALFFELDNDNDGRPPARGASAPNKQRLSSPKPLADELAELDLDESADAEQRRGKR